MSGRRDCLSFRALIGREDDRSQHPLLKCTLRVHFLVWVRIGTFCLVEEEQASGVLYGTKTADIELNCN